MAESIAGQRVYQSRGVWQPRGAATKAACRFEAPDRTIITGAFAHRNFERIHPAGAGCPDGHA